MRLVTITEEAAAPNDTPGNVDQEKRRWVNLIHETLIRSKGLDDKGKPQPYWPTPWNYIEANKDLAARREELDLKVREWRDRRGLARLFGLAGWRDLGRYRRLRIPRHSGAGRFLAWIRRRAGLQLVLLAALTAFVGESHLWTRANELPLDSTLMQYAFVWDKRHCPSSNPFRRALSTWASRTRSS